MSTYNGPQDFLARGLTPITATTAQNSDRGDTTECFICKEPYTESTTDTDGNATTTVNDEPVSIPCGHIFGRECITAWVGTANAQTAQSSNQGTTCPTCRAELFTFGTVQPANGQHLVAMQPMGAGQQIGADQQFAIPGGNVTQTGATGVTMEQLDQLINVMQQLGVLTTAEEQEDGEEGDDDEDI